MYSISNSNKKRLKRKKNIYFSHSFIQCAHGTPYVIPCPSGLVYDPSKIQCVWPADYTCPGSGGTTAAPPPQGTTTAAPPHPPATTAPPPPGTTTAAPPPPTTITAATPPPPSGTKKRVVCYYPNWSYYRTGKN